MISHVSINIADQPPAHFTSHAMSIVRYIVRYTEAKGREGVRSKPVFAHGVWEPFLCTTVRTHYRRYVHTPSAFQGLFPSSTRLLYCGET